MGLLYFLNHITLFDPQLNGFDQLELIIQMIFPDPNGAHNAQTYFDLKRIYEPNNSEERQNSV